MEAVALDSRWLALADGISLAVCTGDSKWVELDGWRVEVGQPSSEADGATVELGLQPFPLAGRTSFELTCRLLGKERFAADSALSVALLATPRRRLRVRAGPL